jgi:hypothetical protein
LENTPFSQKLFSVLQERMTFNDISSPAEIKSFGWWNQGSRNKYVTHKLTETKYPYNHTLNALKFYKQMTLVTFLFLCKLLFYQQALHMSDF